MITRLVRPGTPGWDQEPFTAQGSFEVSLRLSDGRTVSTGKPASGTEPAGPFLRMNGGGGSSRYNQTRWWAWPLPFTCTGAFPTSLRRPDPVTDLQ